MKLFLHEWNTMYLDDLVEYANNPNVARNLRDAFPSPYSWDDGTKFIDWASKAKPAEHFAIVYEGTAIGSIGIKCEVDIHCKNAEVGYWLGEPFWGQGIMPEALKLIVDYTFRTWDVNRIFARPFGTNDASRRVLEKSGFMLEALFEKALFKNGEYLDELVYALRKGD